MAASALTRIRSFQATLGDSNVGTYLYVADRWLHGALPYTVAWEYKPPGLFALFAAVLALFGGNATLGTAVLGVVAVASTALGVAYFVRATYREGGSGVAILAAFLTVVFSTENDGILNDAEILVNAFVALTYAAAVRRGRFGALCAGVAAGAALQMKLTAFALVLPPVVVLLRHEGTRIGRIARLTVFACAAIAPFVVESAVYAAAGAFGSFADANLWATLRRAGGVRGGNRAAAGIAQVREEFRILAPALELTPLALFLPWRNRLWAAWAWLACAAFAILSAAEYYDRHFVLLVPPVAALGAAGAAQLGRWVRAPRAIAAAVVLATVGLHSYYEIEQGLVVAYQREILGRRDFRLGDYADALGALRVTMHGSDSLYVVQFSPMLYADLNARNPTRYVFSADLLETGLWPMIGFHGPDEVARVFAGAPEYVAVGPLDDDRLNPGAVADIEARLRADYRLIDDAHRISIYRRRARP